MGDKAPPVITISSDEEPEVEIHIIHLDEEDNEDEEEIIRTPEERRQRTPGIVKAREDDRLERDIKRALEESLRTSRSNNRSGNSKVPGDVVQNTLKNIKEEQEDDYEDGQPSTSTSTVQNSDINIKKEMEEECEETVSRKPQGRRGRKAKNRKLKGFPKPRILKKEKLDQLELELLEEKKKQKNSKLQQGLRSSEKTISEMNEKFEAEQMLRYASLNEIPPRRSSRLHFKQGGKIEVSDDKGEKIQPGIVNREAEDVQPRQEPQRREAITDEDNAMLNSETNELEDAARAMVAENEQEATGFVQDHVTSSSQVVPSSVMIKKETDVELPEHPGRRAHAEIDEAVAKYGALNQQELNEMYSEISARRERRSMTQSTESPPAILEESKRREEQNRDLNPTSIHNTPSKDIRPEGDQQDQGMSSTSSKRRNTNNSQCASLLSTDMSAVGKPSETLDSDDESDDDDGMSSAGDMSEHTKRPRTPRGRYSPDAQRRTNSRLTMSALSIDTHRAADLNVDGSGPSSSSAASHVQFTPDPDRLPTSHRKKGAQSAIRSRKRRSPSVPVSQDDDDSDTQDEETDDLPIVIDDLSYSISEEAREFFNRAKGDVADEWHFSPKYLAEVYGSLKEGEQARLPEKMHFGKYVMRTWYGSPFPAEYIKVKMMYVCEFCMFYARSDEIMQNHAKKCEIRAPPGIEIYRRDNVSVFEVDGRKQKGYCQTLCLVSRMFLESKTVFYDTEPFFFYVVTMNDEYGCHFAGYFSKEKYEPDVNNLSCIMTLPCYQEQGFGRFLIDVSYALSRKEEWNGGPEQPLSDLGRKAYGGYWKTAVSISLAHFKSNIENGSGVSINMIANHTGINSHDVLEVIGALGWVKPVSTGDTIHDIEWDVDWDMVDMIRREAKASKKIQFHEDCLDWEPRKMKPSMDGYHELTKEEIEEDEIKRKNNLLKTPVQNSESMQMATPTSSSMPVGSVKKELRSRGHNRNVGRNLKLELPKIKVPEPVEGKEVTDEEDEKRKLQKRIKKSLARCSDAGLKGDINREETPDDDQPGPSSKPPGRRPRSTRGNEEHMEPSSSSSVSHGPKTPSSGRHRTRGDGDHLQDTDGPTDSDRVSSDDDDDRPFGSTKGKNGKLHRGRRNGKRRKSVSGKKFPPNFGVRTVTEKEEEKKNGVVDQKPGTSEIEEKMEGVEEQGAEEPHKDRNNDAEKTAASDMEETHDYSNLHPTDEEITKNYDIKTPESYHSSPALSPEPQMRSGQINFSVDDDSQFEENDTAPPLLVSEVHHQSTSEPAETMNVGTSDAPPLVQNDGEEYSSGDDDAPPRLSPQYKNEDMEEMALLPQETSRDSAEVTAPTTAPPPVQQQLSQVEMNYEEPRSYHDPMSAGPPSSIHMTPQMNQMPNSHQNMMTPTPQQHYSQPNSHQQATPGSGGIPSCGPAYNHSTPEQQSQQFMSPQMAGMPASVSSVHSVHNNNSMEMVGGPSSLQHTPQQQYDIGHSMGQMPQENGQMVNGVQSIEQQNQMMMQQHGFNSPPISQSVTQPPQQQQVPQPQQMPQPIPQQPQNVQQPPQVVPIVPAPAATNGRRRSEAAAPTQRRPRQRNTPATAAVQPVVPQPMQYPGMNMMPHMQMAYPFPYGAYPGYQQMTENGFYHYNPAYYPNMFNQMQQMDQAYSWRHQMAVFNNQQIQDGNGAAAAAAAAANGANYQFPPGAAGQMPYFQNNTR